MTRSNATTVDRAHFLSMRTVRLHWHGYASYERYYGSGVLVSYKPTWIPKGGRRGEENRIHLQSVAYPPHLPASPSFHKGLLTMVQFSSTLVAGLAGLLRHRLCSSRPRCQGRRAVCLVLRLCRTGLLLDVIVERRETAQFFIRNKLMDINGIANKGQENCPTLRF